jgi:DNA-directed RNA polymerase II subunit RPB1
MVVTTASVTPAGLEHETLEPNRAGVAVHRTYALGDRVWLDEDRDGLQGAGEPGVAGVTVRLYAAGSDEPVATTTTDADGRYLFDLLPAGTYRVQFVLDGDLAGRYGFTGPRRGDAAEDSDADATGWTQEVTLGADAPRVRPVGPGDGARADYVDPTVDAGLVRVLGPSLPGEPGDPGDSGDPGDPPAGGDPAVGGAPADPPVVATPGGGALAVTGTGLGLLAAAVVLIGLGGLALSARLGRRHG